MKKLMLLLLAACLLLSLAACKPTGNPPDENPPVENPPVVNPPENTEPTDVVGDSLSFIPHPAVEDFVANSSVPVIKIYTVFPPVDFFDKRSMREEIEREDSLILYFTYDSTKIEDHGRGVECKWVENDEADDCGVGEEESVVMYQYVNSAEALFAATPVTRDIASIEIQETYCFTSFDIVDSTLIYFVTDHGDYVYYEYCFTGGNKNYLIPSDLFFEWIQEDGTIRNAPEQYHVGVVEIEKWLVGVWDPIYEYCTVKK